MQSQPPKCLTHEQPNASFPYNTAPEWKGQDVDSLSTWGARSPGSVANGQGRRLNRRERRAAEKHESKMCKGDATEVAAHEAGHAIAYYLSAEMIGFKPDETMDYIRIYSHVDARKANADGLTKGRTFSKDMEGLLDQSTDIHELVSSALSQDMDVMAWLCVMAFVSLMGPVTEAVLTMQDPIKVLGSSVSFGDVCQFKGYCSALELSDDEAVQFFSRTFDLCIATLKREDVTRALQALVKALIRQKKMTGRKACEIISSALTSDATTYQVCREIRSLFESPEWS